MQRRHFLVLTSGPCILMNNTPALADSSGPQLASYYERHMALQNGVAFGWTGRAAPQRLKTGVRQVGVSQDAFFALLDDGQLISWDQAPERFSALMPGVASFACGQSGWFAVDHAQVLWLGGGNRGSSQRVADAVVAACIGDSADYFVRQDGTLWVQGLAHRGQYGDGKLTSTAAFVSTAADAVAVKAHTGHAIYLTKAGVVMGTGGNRFGPLGSHGLGDKADRWGPVFDGASAIATGSRHSVAIRNNGSLWAWGQGFAVQPRQVAEDVVAVAAGDSATIAFTTRGQLLQWDGAAGPRHLRLA
jgi:Regulator of chromosome condensation (RCC1) repeat